MSAHVGYRRHRRNSTPTMLQRLLFLSTFLLFPTLAAAQGVLEVPQRDSFQNGIGSLSGWKCTAGTITVSFNGEPQVPVVYGSDRQDTQSICGDADNGFVLQWNWNLLRDGRHSVQVFDNGIPFADATFTVVTPGEEFFTKGRATVTVSDFPHTGETTTLRWQESTQSFVMIGKGPVDVPQVAGTYQYSASLATNTCSFAPPTEELQETIRITQQGAVLTATTALAGGTQLSGQIEPDQTFVLFSDDSQFTAPTPGCIQILTVVMEGDVAANFVDTIFAYEFEGTTCSEADCEATFLGSWTKER